MASSRLTLGYFFQELVESVATGQVLRQNPEGDAGAAEDWFAPKNFGVGDDGGWHSGVP
jgi:hypothetical protein